MPYYSLKHKYVAAVHHEMKGEGVAKEMCKLPRRCFGGCALLMGDFPKTPGVGCTVSLLLNLCAYVDGHRPHELASRRRDAANWKEKTLLVVADVSKNKRDPLVALTDLAVEILERLKAENVNDSPYIFPQRLDAGKHLRTDSFAQAIICYASVFRTSRCFLRGVHGGPAKH